MDKNEIQCMAARISSNVELVYVNYKAYIWSVVDFTSCILLAGVALAGTSLVFESKGKTTCVLQKSSIFMVRFQVQL